MAHDYVGLKATSTFVEKHFGKISNLHTVLFVKSLWRKSFGRLNRTYNNNNNKSGLTKWTDLTQGRVKWEIFFD
jgi:hypothetical protein